MASVITKWLTVKPNITKYKVTAKDNSYMFSIIDFILVMSLLMTLTML